jgi:hypothetical protein
VVDLAQLAAKIDHAIMETTTEYAGDPGSGSLCPEMFRPDHA